MNLLENYEKEIDKLNERANKDPSNYLKALTVCNQYIFDPYCGFFKCLATENEYFSDYLPSIKDLIAFRNGFLYKFNNTERYNTVNTLDRLKNHYDHSSREIDKSKKLFKDIIANEPEVYKAIEDICGLEKRVFANVSEEDLARSFNKPYMSKSKYFDTNFVYSNSYRFNQNKFNIFDKDYSHVSLINKYLSDNDKFIIPRDSAFSINILVRRIRKAVARIADLIRFITSEINNIDNIFNSQLSKELNNDLEKSKKVYKLAIEEMKSILIRLKSRYNSLLNIDILKNNMSLD